MALSGDFSGRVTYGWLSSPGANIKPTRCNPVGSGGNRLGVAPGEGAW